jgi:signal transduction histidine kinase
MPKEVAEGCRKSDKEALRSEHPFESEESVGDRWFHVIKQRVTDEKGEITGIACVIRDITERKCAEEESKKRVKELEEFYRMAVGREMKMIELKEEIEKLKKELEKYRK